MSTSAPDWVLLVEGTVTSFTGLVEVILALRRGRAQKKHRDSEPTGEHRIDVHVTVIQIRICED